MFRLLLLLVLIPFFSQSQELTEANSIHQFTAIDVDGNEFDFSCLEGQKLLLVNTGSKCMYAPQLKKLQELYDKYNFSIVFTCGFTPLPYKVCTISAGIAEISFLGFMIASAVSRSARFFLVAGLFGWKGEAIKPFIDKYFNWLSLAFVALLIGGFAALKLLHH